jgi:hypothetical protein
LTRPRAWQGLSLVLTLAGAPAAQAQQVEQIGSRPEASRVVQQIPVEFAPPPEARREAPDASQPQLSSSGDSRRQAPQLTVEGRAVRAPAQLYEGGRTAQPSEALSMPSEGRTGHVTPVHGKDRCDRDSGDEHKRAACARVIETRSAEFARPGAATLSPEQRLLVEQRARDSGNFGAVRRLATTGLAAGSVEEQGVASYAINTAPTPTKEAPKEDSISAESAAIINAIVGAAAGAPPQ